MAQKNSGPEDPQVAAHTAAEISIQAQLLRHVREAVIATDMDGCIIYWGAGAERLYGFTADEIMGEDIFCLTVNTVEDTPTQQQVIEMGRWFGPRERRHRDGHIFYTETSLSPIWDEQGQPMGFVSVDRDVTERRQQEQALRESERRNEALLNAIPDMMARMGIDGTYRDVRAAPDWKPLFTPEQAIGRSAYELLPPHLAQMRMANLRRALETGKLQVFNYQLMEQGEIHYYESRVVPCGPDETLSFVRDITDQRRAQMALEASERENRLLLDAIPDLLARIDRQGIYRYLHASPIWTPYFCLEQAIGKSVEALMPADVAAATIAGTQRALDTGQPQTYDYELLENGEMRHYEARVIPSGPDEVLGIVRDVTDQHRSQLALEKSEHNLQSLLAAIPDLLARINRQGIFLYFRPSPVWAPLFSTEEAIGKSVNEILPPHVAAATLEAVQRVLEADEPWVYHYELQEADGTHYYESRMVRAGEDEALAMVRDITDRRQTEQSLHLKNRAIDAAVNAMSITDLDGYNTYVNAAFLALWGYDSADEVLGLYGPDFWHEPEKAQEIILALQERGAYSGELRAKRKDGSLLDVQLAASLILDEKGAPANLVGSFVDITPRKRYEAEMKRRAAELATLNELGLALSDAADLNRMANVALEHVLRATGLRIGGLYLLDEAQQLFRLVATRGLSLAQSRHIKNVPMHAHPVSQLLETLEPAIVDVHSDLPAWQKETLQPAHLTQFLVLPLIARDRLIGTVNVGSAEPLRAFSERDMALLKAMGAQIGPNIETAQLNQQLQQAQEQLRALSARLTRTLEAERANLSRELHDEVGQALTAIKLTLQMTQAQLASSPPPLRDALRGSIELVDETTRRVRQLSANLRPVAIEELGLVAAMREQIKRFQSSSKTKVYLLAGDFEAELSFDQETALYRIMQEALTNVARYAQASEVFVYLVSEDEQVRLIIQDDGLGFDPDIYLDTETGHLGIVGMRERADLVGGTLEIKSAPNEGTTITAQIPIETGDNR